MTVLLKLVQTGFCSASKQPNLQTKKRYCSFHHQDFWTENFFFLRYDDVYRAEGYTAVDIRFKSSLKKLYLKILMRETCLGFSTLKNYTEVATLAASGGFIKILSPHVVYTKIFVRPSQILYVFSSTFQHHKKVV